jgi:hypothetical protein
MCIERMQAEVARVLADQRSLTSDPVARSALDSTTLQLCGMMKITFDGFDAACFVRAANYAGIYQPGVAVDTEIFRAGPVTITRRPNADQEIGPGFGTGRYLPADERVATMADIQASRPAQTGRHADGHAAECPISTDDPTCTCRPGPSDDPESEACTTRPYDNCLAPVFMVPEFS